MRARLVVCFTFTLISTGAVLGNDWPTWRGPLGIGVTTETGLPERWSETTNIAWRVKLPGTGVSTPVIAMPLKQGAAPQASPLLFVTSQIGSGARRPGSHPSLVQGADAATAGERNLSRGASVTDTVTFAVTAYRWSDGSRAWHHEMPAEGPLPGVHDKHNLSTASPVTD